MSGSSTRAEGEQLLLPHCEEGEHPCDEGSGRRGSEAVVAPDAQMVSAGQHGGKSHHACYECNG